MNIEDLWEGQWWGLTGRNWLVWFRKLQHCPSFNFILVFIDKYTEIECIVYGDANISFPKINLKTYPNFQNWILQ